MYFATEPKPGQLSVIGQVVVHRLRDVDGLDRVAHGLGELRHLEAGVGGVAAAVVEEVADVVRLEHLDQALVLGAAFLQTLQLEAAGTERARRRVAQGRDRVRRFLAGVDQVFRQRADDAVPAGVDLADLVLVPARRFDDAAGGRVDDGSDAAGLGVKGISLRHENSSFECWSEGEGRVCQPNAEKIAARISSTDPTPGILTCLGAPGAPEAAHFA